MRPPPSLAPPALRQGEMLADYIATSASELSVRAGERVSILRADASGWTEVVNAAGGRGFVPGTFVRLL